MPIRENKFARQQKLRRNPNLARDNVVTTEQVLARLEEDIRRLKVEFDVFFNGAAKRPPYDTKSRVEGIIKRIADDRTLTFAQRYQYNSLVSRFTSFRELWRRTLQGREEGVDVASAARAAHRQETAGKVESATFVCTNAHQDIPTVKEIYEALIEAKRQCGESTSDLSFPRFHHLIATKTDKLKETLGCDSVRFSVGIEDGRVNFKAKADKE